MADPLSIAASIIAVVGAAESVTKVLSKIKNMRHAPDELLALINEVSDLRVILSNIHGYVVERTQHPKTSQEGLQLMAILLDRAKEK